MRQVYINQIMIKSKRFILFFNKNVCDEDEKNTFILIKHEKFHENPRIKDNEKRLSNILKVIYNEFKKI